MERAGKLVTVFAKKAQESKEVLAKKAQESESLKTLAKKAQEGKEVLAKKAQEGRDVLSERSSAFNAALPGVMGIKAREKSHEGSLTIRNCLSSQVTISFHQFTTSRMIDERIELLPDTDYSFAPAPSADFDFLLIVNMGKATFCVVRGGSYALRPHDTQEGAIGLETVSGPLRRTSEALATAKYLSFSFSASGWLFVYQLGAAECLQNHGILTSPYVRVAGSSGGALTAALMMYGADMRMIRDIIKRRAQDVHADCRNSVNLREFLFDAMKSVIRDGSYLHPAFQEGRVEVAVSEVGTEAKAGYLTKIKAIYNGGDIAKGRRCKSFSSSSEAAIALLASATMGISGLPFNYTNEEGKEVKVADGALLDFMPLIDNFSVKVKPFCEPIGIGGRPDVAPTEWVSGTLGVWPAKPERMDHLYEMGYRDMETWIEKHLHERLAQIEEANLPEIEERPPVAEFVCPSSSLSWVDDVLSKVPVDLKDQFSMSRRPSTRAPSPGADGAPSPSAMPGPSQSDLEAMFPNVDPALMRSVYANSSSPQEAIDTLLALDASRRDA